MTFELNQTVSSFRVTGLRRSAELRADIVELEHVKTGCRLFWLNNGAENKVFSIAFRTLPEDNTGVFHILEHSVLCGSDKYPVREPFVELLKGSMNTFLNAMTFSDMTMYPVGSRNDRDLLNLTEVYLDAVFRPRCVKDELVFRQEGWHIEPDDQGNPIYKGVVFNEMKGSMSDVDTLGERQIMRQLFPDNGYGFNSGGDPEAIPDLTWEKYLDQYRRHYHPSNAVIYLDGEVPMDQMLPLIASYLDSYDRLTDLPPVPFQTPVGSDQSLEFELGQDEETANRGQVYLSRIVGTWRDKTKNMALSLIGDVLAGANDAPFKRRILEKELAQDFDLSVDDTCEQSYILFHAENVTDGCEDALLDEIRAYGRELSETGLDRGALEASLNRMVFALKEEDEPQGIGRAIRATGIWILGGDPLAALENDDSVSELRRMIDDGELDRLAADLFRADPSDCILRLLPSHTLGDRKRREEEARLRRITDAWTDADRERNRTLVAALRTWQDTPDTPEALATLPMLRKEDADIPPVWTDTEETSVDGVRLLIHRIPCGGVIHLRVMFPLSNFTTEEMIRIHLLCTLMGKIPTERYDALTLQQEIKRTTGRLGFSVFCRSHPDDPSLCAPALVASASVLPEHLEKAEALLAEILLRSDWSATEKIMEIVLQTDLAIRQRTVSAGHFIGVRNVLSHYSAEYALKNALEGDEAIRYLHAFIREPERHLADLSAAASLLLATNLCRANMLLSLTADDPVDWTPFISQFSEGTAVPEFGTWTHEAPLRRGYRIPAQIGYTVRGYRLSECGEAYHGIMWLTANILSLSYLWNRVRVQGGAYGTGFSIDRNGNMYSYSYRDPTPDRTLGVHAGMSAFLKEFVNGDEGLDKFIISSLNDLNPLLSAREKGALADARFLNRYTREKAEAIRREILHAAPEDLLHCASWLDAFAKDGAVCVVAPGEFLEKCDDLDVEDL